MDFNITPLNKKNRLNKTQHNENKILKIDEYNMNAIMDLITPNDLSSIIP